MMSDVFDLDELLDDAVLGAALGAGQNLAVTTARFGVARVLAARLSAGADLAAMQPAATRRSPDADRWTVAETAFLRQYAGVLGDEEIARRLGRSVAAIDVRRMRAGLPAPSTHQDYITANQAGRALGVDPHNVIRLIERGLLPAEVAPLSGRVTWRMKRTAFYAWALNPMHWPYFYRSVRRPTRIGDEKLRRLIVLKAARWLGPDGLPDAWWTPGEVADYHGVHHTDVNRYIHHGRLPGVKWGNQMVRRSDATRADLRFFKGKGAGLLARAGTARGDAFLILAAAVGIPYTQSAHMVGRGHNHSFAQSRLRNLERAGYIPQIIRAYGLPVDYRTGVASFPTGGLWADWREVAHRFPRLAAVWERGRRGELRARDDMRDLYLVNGVLRQFIAWHYGPQHPLVDGLAYRVEAAEREAWRRWEQWEKKTPVAKVAHSSEE